MKTENIIDRHQGMKPQEYLSLHDFPPSKHELYRQLLVSRDWCALWAIVAAAGWVVAGIVWWVMR